MKNCVDCGHCCHGCPYKSKQSTQTALMEPLLLAGSGLEHASCQGSCASATSATAAASYKLNVIPHCHVTKVLYETTGAGSVKGGDGSVYPCYKRAIGVEAMVRELPDNFADWSVGDRLKFLNETVNLPRYSTIQLYFVCVFLVYSFLTKICTIMCVVYRTILMKYAQS